jgi:8-oxo-dGTP diphosphatase
VTHVHLATGLAIRADGTGRRAVLAVASRYPNRAEPLWNLPGGRQLPGELLEETVVREVFEETGLRVRAGEIAYVSESYDGETHFLNVTFQVEIVGRTPVDSARGDTTAVQANTDHVVEAAWLSVDELRERIVVAVVREPLLAYLAGSLPRHYAGFHEAGVTIEWPPDSR